jgi:hypothetical protein
VPMQGNSMTDLRSDTVPMNHPEGSAEDPVLQWLEFKQLQQLRNLSHSIRSLGFLWGFSGLVAVYLGATMIAAHGRDMSLGLLLVPYGLVTATVGPYSAWARPRWGRVVCMVLCIPSLGQLPYGTLLGVLSLMALSGAEPLFSDHKIPHKELEAAFKARRP